ncbi:hypothetical protein [Terrisporobacter hibernicus]|uniref:Uncharacterized protein n=1 Tax=Terrisporobacter hibernicus TaxID=2813371 RepID=A0AAX2ZG66_9FIRM|nr:hypothetical protein [Terrisporobacter hibernicus]UEL48298.1 hypothetical protein JW646_02260 [Terrisporobacter hibernicus]
MGIFSIFSKNKNKDEIKKQNECINNSHELNNLDSNSKQIIAKLINHPCNLYYSDAMQTKARLRNILNTKLARVSYNQDEYAESLKRNILYYINTLEDKENVIKGWINDGRIPQLDICISTIDSIQDTYKGNNAYSKNTEKLKVYDKFFPITQQIEQLEYDYMFYSIHSEIVHMLLEVILNNQEEFLKLRNCNPNLVVKDINGYCTHTASYCLGTLNSDLNK